MATSHPQPCVPDEETEGQRGMMSRSTGCEQEAVRLERGANMVDSSSRAPHILATRRHEVCSHPDAAHGVRFQENRHEHGLVEQLRI